MKKKEIELNEQAFKYEQFMNANNGSDDEMEEI